MKKITLTQGQFALVDDKDYNKLNKHKWNAMYSKKTKSFYATRRSKKGEFHTKRTIYMHRVVMNAPKNMQVDHIFHNTLDNRKSKLRLVTNSQNSMNSRKRKDNTSNVIGVNWHKAGNKWCSEIHVNKKKIYLGLFYLKCQAVKARKEAEKKYHGEYAYNP